MNAIDKNSHALKAAAPDIFDALIAIWARVTGEFDNPELMAYGPLSTDPKDDIIDIARKAIAKAERAIPQKDKRLFYFQSEAEEHSYRLRKLFETLPENNHRRCLLNAAAELNRLILRTKEEDMTTQHQPPTKGTPCTK